MEVIITAESFFDKAKGEIIADKNIDNLVKETIEKKYLNDYFKDCSDTKIIIPILQKTNEYFIKNYEIQIHHNDLNLTIIPIEAEIYFANKSCHGACHENDRQQNNFGKLYFHRRGKKKDLPIDIIRGGVDICISNGPYYLSILIRSAYFIKDNKEDKNLVIGIRNIVDRIILEYCKKKKEEYEEIKKILEQRDKKEKLKGKEILIRKKLKEIEDSQNIVKLIKDKENSNKEVEKHCRIKGNDYFSPYNELKRAELNSFINDNEIIKKMYKDKSLEIREHLGKKLGNKNLFKK